MAPDTVHSSAELSRRARGAFFWLGTTTVIWQLAAWAFTILTARLLTPADYGLLALADTINPYLAMLASLNIGTWIIQRTIFSHDDVESALSLSLLGGSVMALLAFFAAPVAATFYSMPELVAPLRVLSVSFLLRAVALIPDSQLRRELHFKPIGIMNVVVVVARGALQVVLALNGFGYWALVAGILFKDAAECAWLVAARGLPRRFQWRPQVIKEAVRFGLPATLGTLCWVLYSSADTIFVGKLLGAEVLGFYAMALYLIDMPLSKLNTVVRPVLYPYFSRVKDIPGAFNDSFLKAVRMILAIAFPAILGIAAISHELVTLVLGMHWAPTGEVLPFLCLTGLFKAFIDNVHVAFTVMGRPGLVLRFNCIGVLILPISFYLLGSAYGLYGIFLAWGIVLPVLCYLNLRSLKQLTGISPTAYLVNSLAPAVSAVVMVVGVVVTGVVLRSVLPVMPVIAIQVVAGAGLYVGSYLLFFREEFFQLLSFRKALTSTSPSSPS